MGADQLVFNFAHGFNRDERAVDADAGEVFLELTAEFFDKAEGGHGGGVA